MKKILLAVSMFTVATGTAFAAWEPVLTSSVTETQFRAVTAGKSGNVKECFQSTVRIDTFTWTHTQTGNTRGTFTTTTITDEVQVDDSQCEPA
ncbi:hypothetical protein EHS39_33495 [Ensifer sp. MPMI2T]|nr:hypothetical protein EHS39_33495 [Ensifer sp. MPMI2T]